MVHTEHEITTVMQSHFKAPAFIEVLNKNGL